jgi:hypothetical protein
MDYFTKWPEAYAIPNQEVTTVAEGQVTKFFCRLRVLRELHIDQGRNFELRLMQEVLQRLEMNKTLHPSTRSWEAWWNNISKR